MRVQTGDNVGIGGFIITGTAPKRVLLRAIGPSLLTSAFRCAWLIRCSNCTVRRGFTTIINNNWRDTQENEIQATGIAPTNDLESAIDRVPWPRERIPGSSEAMVTPPASPWSKSTTSIRRLPRSWPTSAPAPSSSTGDNIVIAGFILGNSPGNDRIVVRGIGPSLTGFGVPNALANPTLELRDNNGALLVSNNDWQDDPAQAAELTAAGLAPTNTLESAIAATLPPGLYTALLAGLNNGTGVGLVEVYDRGAP